MTNSMGWTCGTDVSYSKPDGTRLWSLRKSRLREPSMLSTEITVKQSVAFDD